MSWLKRATGGARGEGDEVGRGREREEVARQEKLLGGGGGALGDTLPRLASGLGAKHTHSHIH